MKRTGLSAAGTLALVALLAAPGLVAAGTVTMHHVHGLAFSADGGQLLIASHKGLAIYADGRWSMMPGPQHDYMGFSATRRHYYSSGHPAPGSALVNPLGLIRSDDGGRKWNKLGLEGESDFHQLATGYESDMVYVYNPEPNRRMKTPGIYATLNDGFAWRRADAKGLDGKLIALAVHPTDARTIAAGSSAGLFMSSDGGDRFERIAGNGQVLAAHFALGGRELWFANHDGKPRLFRMDLGTRTSTEIALPPLTNDAVAYIAQNPAAPSTYAIATFERDVYVTTNAGGQWRQIAERGRTKQ